MATKKTTQISIAMLAVIAVVVWGFVYFTMRAAGNGFGTKQSNVSPSTTLTAGDDGLSLQQDLNALQHDPTLNDESQLNSIQ